MTAASSSTRFRTSRLRRNGTSPNDAGNVGHKRRMSAESDADSTDLYSEAAISEFTQHFATLPSRQISPDRHGDVFRDEPDRSVAHGSVHATDMLASGRTESMSCRAVFTTRSEIADAVGMRVIVRRIVVIAAGAARFSGHPCVHPTLALRISNGFIRQIYFTSRMMSDFPESGISTSQGVWVGTA